MEIPEPVRKAYRLISTIGEISSLLWLLVLFGVIEEPLLGSDFLRVYYSYFVALALAIFWACTVWIGWQLHAWRTSTEVKWYLSGSVQPVPPFGSQDMPESDKASKLHVSQRGATIKLDGRMRRLKPLCMYHVQLALPYTPGKLAVGTIIGRSAPYAFFTTDKSGSGNWSVSEDIKGLQHYGIVDAFVVWVNDAPKNASVLGSAPITIRL